MMDVIVCSMKDRIRLAGVGEIRGFSRRARSLQSVRAERFIVLTNL